MTTGKRRDSARSRALLLEAAASLFAERGYDRSTTREIGERAGVDPALIARYFGGKAQLYLAALDLDRASAPPADLLEPERTRMLLEAVARRGAGPLFRAAITPLEDPEVQAAAMGQLGWRLVDPLCQRFTREGLDRPQLRAELLVASFLGVILSRNSGAFRALAEADTEEVVQLVLGMLDQSH
ncbi:TetR/AcrR family transcriptional regulator [Actinacidiphila yeochonensis]|uniref:TetR/AcrR family transcriptional regulator n=1 Tax=Actinacidiphila yeochonensis TaxID=89050 RepID=UPI00068D4CD6|nr:TetR/AcrR family transcriptional regulator [Actinacidiphila yeochonensis]